MYFAGHGLQVRGRNYLLPVDADVAREDEVHLASGSVTDTVGNFTRIVRNAERIEVYKPSNQFYVFPLKPGATWNLKTHQELGDKQYDIKI